MNITTPHINPYKATHAYAQQPEHPIHQQTALISDQPDSSSFKQETMKQEDLQTTTRSEAVLSGKEKATLHGLFGTDKPSEMTFYGHKQIQNIHRGQLLDIKG